MRGLCLVPFLLGVLTTTKTLAGEVQEDPVKRRYNGLQFGGTAQDYVLFKTRMDVLQESWSLCGWVKKRLAEGNRRYWFSYGTPNRLEGLWSTDHGYLYTMGIRLDMSSRTTVKLGVWSHWCSTWSFSTRNAKLYHNGQLLGSDTTGAGTNLSTEEYVVLGNAFNSQGGGFGDANAFGGDLFKANVFDKELDASEVKEMAEGGLCSDVEEKYGRSRYLKWEDLLLEEKTGNVTEIDVGCYPEEKECDKSFCKWDLLREGKFFNKTVTTELLEEIRQSWDMLGRWNIRFLI